jgi:hypothetical protein
MGGFPGSAVRHPPRPRRPRAAGTRHARDLPPTLAILKEMVGLEEMVGRGLGDLRDRPGPSCPRRVGRPPRAGRRAVLTSASTVILAVSAQFLKRAEL